MSKQNIYDDEHFFTSYKNLRSKPNANDLVETPALLSLLPNLKGKRVLDIGCGTGDHCKRFVELGAAFVLGLDISEKMLAEATRVNSSDKIKYVNLSIEELADLDGKFDVVVSSLALHYVKGFDRCILNIRNKLVPQGYFIYSQEHPMNTCFTTGNRWAKDEDGNKISTNISNYSIDGKRESYWFKEGIIKYHRTFETIINTFIDNNFIIMKVLEPRLSQEKLRMYPSYVDNLHKPDFLLIKVKKSKSESNIIGNEEGNL